MTYEVVVVGGGIGGLTVAALLAARGVNVCVLERESSLGGCLAGFEKFGYNFDPGVGLYPLWQPGAIHARVFAELPVEPPEVQPLEPAYVVRLPDHSEVSLKAKWEDFEENLAAVFPECAQQAIEFYREMERISDALRTALRRVPDFPAVGSLKQLYALRPKFLMAAQIVKAKDDTVLKHLEGASLRFRRFLDVQLQLLAQSATAECSYLYSALALTIPRQGTFSIRGGAAGLVAKLAESINASGGRIRLDSPVLRLAYNTSGAAVGVDLLSGEAVHASRAIVSNLTIWDTYGKLVGLNRTPADIRKLLGTLRGWGTYLVYAGMDEAAAGRLPHSSLLALTDWQEQHSYNPEMCQFMFAAAPEWDVRAPEGKRAVTVQTFTDVEHWFTFQEDEEQHERQDQSFLEASWRRLHETIPELGSDFEVIETATPRTFYDVTRRKLGMVGSPGYDVSVQGVNCLGYRTFLPNLFMVGDTIFPGAGVAAVTHSALVLANHLTR
jgi:C-3',4' desaturase CrtD